MNLRPYLLASRPKTLPAALAPVIIGTAMAFADGGGHWPSALLAAFGAIMIQIGTNYANDYYDYIKGSDDQQTRLGPLRATAAGLVTPRAMRNAFIIAYAIAAAAGIYLLVRAGWPVLIIGALSILFGILYTGGPFPLGYNGLGDIFVFVFFGLVAVAGIYYVQTLGINALVLMAGIAPGLMSTAILAVNNLRDIDNDKRTGKRTLPVVLGASLGRLEYVLCLSIACCMPILLVILTGDHFFSISAGIVIFFAVPQIRTLYREQPGGVYNTVLARTGQLLVLFSVLFSIGWLV
ncbi:1,4-dihydroxy-2-naphthoate polyprenyltransferase [candidate division KSB1 bacterium]|nr:1,4-dihydroxy-2-naphthoate polyprenyltransferase [candidate division KSB1 bacterium]